MQVNSRYSGKEHKKGWIKAIILIIAWIIIVSLVKDLWQIKKGFSRIEESKQRLSDAQLKNQTLQDKMNLVSTEQYKEQLIREQLNMQKPGEVIAVLPKKETKTTMRTEETENSENSNWEKWWSLLK